MCSSSKKTLGYMEICYLTFKKGNKCVCRTRNKEIYKCFQCFHTLQTQAN